MIRNGVRNGVRKSVVVSSCAVLCALAFGCDRSPASEQQKATEAQQQANQKADNAQARADYEANKAQTQANQQIREADRTVMKQRDDAKQELRKDYDELKTKIDEFQTKATKAKPEAKNTADSQVTDFRNRAQTIDKDITALDSEPATTLDAARDRVKKEISDLKGDVGKAEAHL
jgi:uncharacterized protein involved in copper resistance